MQKIGTLTVDGLVTAIYDVAQRESVVKQRGLPTKDAQRLMLAQAVNIKVEPLSKSALHCNGCSAEGGCCCLGVPYAS